MNFLKRLLNNQNGALPVLVVVAILALLSFIAVSSAAPLKDNLYNMLYPKAASQAADPSAMKVLVIKYFPLDSNGQNLDPTITGMNQSLTVIRDHVNTITTQGIQQLTNGTKFRGYKNESTQSAINYEVIDTKEYLEALPVSTNKVPWNTAYRPSYQQILTRENICNYVDSQGVQQVWLWGYHTATVEPSESNMAMGTSSQTFWNHGNYGDVSNGEQINDMPVCQKTYTLYNYNYGRGLGELLENHGHQLEAVYRFVDNNLWEKYQKPNGDTNQNVINHCGWTHSPPNSGDWLGDRGQYDWSDKTLVKSDCEDWKPDGGGVVKDLNCNTWYEPFYKRSYQDAICQEDGGVAFKVWWMQNIPGLNSNLTYQGQNLKNWWDFYVNFDQALAAGKTLYLKNPELPAGVVVKDSFNRANASTLVQTETGQNWEIMKGSFGITDSVAYPSNGCPAPGYAVVDTGFVDGVYEITLPVIQQDLRVPFRVKDLNNMYWIEARGGNTYDINRMVNGVHSSIAQLSGISQNGDKLKIKLSGSLIEVYVNGTLRAEVIDTNLTGTKYGIGTWCNGAVRFDDFQFSKFLTPTPSPTPTTQPTPTSSPAINPIRINVGGSSVTDSNGTHWSADNSFTGGKTYTANSSAVYKDVRYENFDYRIAVPNGNYSVVLKFEEIYYTQVNRRIANVSLENQLILTNFDIVQEAGGAFKPVDKTFPVTISDGFVDLSFRSVKDNAMVNGIEIIPLTTSLPTPEPESEQLRIRINTGGANVTDTANQNWLADKNYLGGTTYKTNNTIQNTTDQNIYNDVRYANAFSYQIPLRNGSYQVKLKFAEVYFTQPDKRIFNVDLEGGRVLTNYDIVRDAGAFKAVDKTYTVTVSDGVLNINLNAVKDNALINGIEILSQ